MTREGNITQYSSSTPRVLAMSNQSGRIGPFGPGLVELWSEADCFLAFGDVTVQATTAGIPLTGKVAKVVRVDSGIYIAGIVGSGTPNLYATERLL